MKLCECGCGKPSGVYLRTNGTYGQVAGEPRRFIPNHHQRADRHHKWNGGKSSSEGYALVRSIDHPRANRGRYVREHILIAERAFGGPLPEKAIVHHVNENRGDNRNRNLVICQDQAFHKYLHQRMAAYAATGNASSVKCSHCQTWGITGEGEMRTKKSGRSYHLSCNAAYEDSRRRKGSALCQA